MTLHHSTIKLIILFALYVALIFFGVYIGFEFEGFTTWADALLFSVTNYTTAGLITPRDERNSLVYTTISLLIGIPINALFWGEISAIYFATCIQKKAEEEEAELEDELLDSGAAGADGGEGEVLKEGSREERYIAFIQAELISSGMVKEEHFEHIAERFDEHEGEEPKRRVVRRRTSTGHSLGHFVSESSLEKPDTES